VRPVINECQFLFFFPSSHLAKDSVVIREKGRRVVIDVLKASHKSCSSERERKFM